MRISLMCCAILFISCGQNEVVVGKHLNDETISEKSSSADSNSTAKVGDGVDATTDKPDIENENTDLPTDSDDDSIDTSPTSPSQPVIVPTASATPNPTPTPIVVYPTSPYMVTYSNVEMKVYPPRVSNAQTKLAIFLHGDTANGYFEEYYTSLKNYAQSQNWLFVAALSPNRDSWWHQNAFAYNLDEALVALNKKQIFSYSDIKFSGVSGGSTFLSMQFIPQVGMRYSGTVAATCGGSSSSLFRSYEKTALAQKYKMYFIYGENDFLADPNGTYGNVIGAAISQYTGLNFFVRTSVLPNYTHCAFDVNQKILDVWRL